MPELPEVETIKESLRKAVEGAKIESVLVNNRCLRISIPHDFEKIVTGHQIKKLYRIAKYAIMDLDNAYSIVWHFGMSGKIKLLSTKNPILEKHDHIVVKTSADTIVYNDPRRFGLITVLPTDKLKEDALFCHLGPDPFDANLNENYLFRKFQNKKTAIKIALLDQNIVAGIGNIYASEALYESGISPLRCCSSLNKNELKKLISAIRITLSKAIDAGGSTLHDYRKPDGSAGYFQLQHSVYGKDGQCCPKCKKNCIIKITQGGRSTYYCPHTQK